MGLVKIKKGPAKGKIMTVTSDGKKGVYSTPNSPATKAVAKSKKKTRKSKASPAGSPRAKKVAQKASDKRKIAIAKLMDQSIKKAGAKKPSKNTQIKGMNGLNVRPRRKVMK